MTTIERPVFILAPPRSGSTLLFETLSRCAGLWSLGDEGHGIIERHPRLRPRPFSEDCNRLLAGDLSDELGREIRNDFLNQIQDNNERKLSDRRCPSVRLIEKTPKNILRIPFILRLFPDACFIYLYRDARENISSIMEGWSSGRFTTYMDKPTRHGLWSFLLPPDWHRHTRETLAEIAAFQWSACHEYAMQDLRGLEPDRWCALNYAEFLADTEPVVERLCQFMAVPMDDGLRRHCRESLPISRYTLSAPAADKWRQQAQALAPLMPGAAALCNRINNFTAGYSTPLATELAIDLSKVGQGRKIGRNEPCPCGSGSKYKHCHGRI